MDPSEPAERPEPIVEGGTPVCYLPQVCPQCGRLADDEPPTTCPRCGAAIEIP